MSDPSRRGVIAWALRVGALALAFALGAALFSGPRGVDDAHLGHEAHAEVWTCSMHPQVRQPEAGPCPVCGMDLILAGPDEGSAESSADRVVLSERARTLARLQTTPVRRQGDAAASLRLLGRVEPDETTRKNVTTWVAGRIDRLHVNATGEQVRAGQVIATLYSPEVYGAHQDLLTAKAQVERMSGRSASAEAAAVSALKAARERLRLQGVPERELSQMEVADRPTQAVTIRTPFSGTVIERVTTEGAYVETGTPLYRVADLGRLWVQLDAYEGDLQRIEVGQQVSLSADGLPGKTYSGSVAFIDPTIDSRRRTARVRVEVDNPDRALRPGMFAEALVSSAAPVASDAPLVIPDTAPLFTGERSLVYVEVERDQQLGYEPRTVRLGPRLGTVFPVVAGLSEGERVVSRGAFAIDADLQIRGGASMMTAPGSEAGAPMPVQLPDLERAKLTPVVTAYLEVSRALAADDLSAATRAADQVEAAARAGTVWTEAAPDWPRLAEALRSHARQVSMSRDLQGARAGFEPLSAAIETLLAQYGNPLAVPVHVAFCPMANGDRGAAWVQRGDAIDNAYFGDRMRFCGEITRVVPPGEFLAPTGSALP